MEVLFIYRIVCFYPYANPCPPPAPFPPEVARGSTALRWVPDPAPHLCKSIGAYGIPGFSNLLLLLEEHFLTNGFPMGWWLPTPSHGPKQEDL